MSRIKSMPWGWAQPASVPDQAARLEQVGPNRDNRLRNGGCVPNRYAGRHAHTLTFGYRAKLGIPAPAEQGTDGIAHSPARAGAGAKPGDVPGNFHAQDGRGPRRRRIVSLALQQIRTVDPGRYGLDQHLSDPWLWDREQGNTKNLGSTRACDVDSVHGLGKGG